MSIEEKIINNIEDGNRDITTLLWALVGIVNVNSNFGVLPDIEDIIKDMQSAHNKYPCEPKRCLQVYLESMHALLEKWEKTHTKPYPYIHN